MCADCGSFMAAEGYSRGMPTPLPSEGPVQLETGDKPIFPAEQAFVVQFRAGSDTEGRVEHVVSGKGARFHCVADMVGFMTQVVRQGPDDAD